MPTSYSFITFGDLSRMRDQPAKSQIRKHAMKDIGASRRRPRMWTAEFEVRSCVTSTECSTLPSNAVQTPPPAMPDEQTKTDSREDRFVRRKIPRTGNCISPAVCAGSDPFNSASVGINGSTQILLQYFIYYSSAFPNNFTFSPCISRTVTAAIHDELLMNCILSAAASRIHYLQSASRPDFRRQETCATQQGLRLLKSSVPKTCPRSITQVERLITCVLYLGAGAFYRHDTAAARIHLDAAVRIAQSAGGIKHLKDEQTIVRLVSMDDLISCAELESCSVDDSYDPGPSAREDLNDLSEAHPTRSILAAFESVDDRILPPALRDAIPQIVACRELKYDLAHCDNLADFSALKKRYWITLRMLAIRNRLLAFMPSDDRANAMRLTLIMWTLLPPCDPRQARLSQTVASKMMEVLVGISDSAWVRFEEMRFACLIMGSFCAEERSDVKAWFVEEVRRVLHEKRTILGIHIDARIRESLIAFQRRFYLDDWEIRKRTEALADYVRFREELTVT